MNNQTNGERIVGIKKKGRIKFRVEDGENVGETVTVDVVAANNEWARLDRSFRDPSTGRIRQLSPEEQAAGAPDPEHERDGCALRFAKDHLGDADLSLADAYDFITRLGEEVAALETFFTPRLPEKPSLPESSTTLTTCN